MAASSFPSSVREQMSVSSIATPTDFLDSPISRIPDEMFFSIFSYFGIQTLGRASRVSKKWRDISEDHVFWRHLLNERGFVFQKEIALKKNSISLREEHPKEVYRRHCNEFRFFNPKGRNDEADQAVQNVVDVTEKWIITHCLRKSIIDDLVSRVSGIGIETPTLCFLDRRTYAFFGELSFDSIYVACRGNYLLTFREEERFLAWDLTEFFQHPNEIKDLKTCPHNPLNITTRSSRSSAWYFRPIQPHGFQFFNQIPTVCKDEYVAIADIHGNIHQFDWSGKLLFKTKFEELDGVSCFSSNGSCLTALDDVGKVAISDTLEESRHPFVELRKRCNRQMLSGERWIAILDREGLIHIWRLSKQEHSIQAEKIYEDPQEVISLQKLGEDTFAALYKTGVKIIWIDSIGVKMKDVPVQNLCDAREQLKIFAQENMIYIAVNNEKLVRLTFN